MRSQGQNRIFICLGLIALFFILTIAGSCGNSGSGDNNNNSGECDKCKSDWNDCKSHCSISPPDPVCFGQCNDDYKYCLDWYDCSK